MSQLKRISLLQIIGIPCVAFGVIRLWTGHPLNGVTWVLLGITLLTYKFPLDSDGMIKFDRRSLIAYVAGLAAVGLMVYAILSRE